MSGVTQAVERTIAEELPSHFGVMFDGVTYASEHYVAWFACFERHGELVTVLLGMAPLLNEPNDDLSARTHLEFLATMLPRDYEVQIKQCRFLVGDNCAQRNMIWPSTKKMWQQYRPFDLLDVRQWFDERIAVKPQYERFLGPRADIVHSPYFEAAVCEFCAAGKTA
ncbi:hypothetical protein JG688_00017759 [Phytophthora aleatoria]|uniref:Uncharacterized protein n=1 Tax=Phytophthora aleatoria TaxID=2496075 RepID=A0A8J5ID92_9STRA|nr:hypothetical protein JG688_00017759 [Phytophthora aleatoria]